MKELILIAIVFASCLILLPERSNATDYTSESKDYQETTIPGITGNTFGTDTLDINKQLFPAEMDRGYLNKYEVFRKGLSYSGSCDSLPKGAICLRYSDNYNWVVSDFRVYAVPLIVGVSSYKPIELIRCYNADYYHVLGTSLIMSTPHNYFIPDLN